MTKVTKAIFPVAGLGTRFLPITKTGPKEMLPIVDKPLLQYAVEEAMAADITEMIFVTGQWENIVRKHFEKSYTIETQLAIRQDIETLNSIRKIKPSHVHYHYVSQPKANGLGQAVLCAEKLIQNSPFAVMLVDDLLSAQTPVIKQMIELFKKKKCSIIAVEEISKEDSSFYGVIDIKTRKGKLIEFNQIIEKPQPDEAPSNLGVVGRYIFTHDIFNHLRQIKPGKNREIQLTDGIQRLREKKQMLAYQYMGKRFDCGSKLGFLKATVEFGLKHQEVGKKFDLYLKDLNKKQKT